MKEKFFEEYELRIYARVAVPKMIEPGRASKELFEAVQATLGKRTDMLVALTTTTFEPLQGDPNERSKAGF